MTDTPDKRRCPECGRPASARHAPFCCKRCADLDLGRWLDGSYCIPTGEPAPTAAHGEDDGEG